MPEEVKIPDDLLDCYVIHFDEEERDSKRIVNLIERIASLTTQLQQATARAESAEKALARMKAPVSDEEWSAMGESRLARNQINALLAARKEEPNGK